MRGCRAWPPATTALRGTEALTRKGEVQPAMEGHVRRVSILSGAHELRVLDGRLGDRGGRRLLAHHADPVVRPRFLSDPRGDENAAGHRCSVAAL